MHGESGNSVPTLGGRGNTSFASDTASAAGVTKRSLNEHISRAEALGPDLHAVVGTSLDKGVELDALKELSPEEYQPFARTQGAEAEAERLREGLADASARVDDASPSECGQCRTRVAG